MVMIIIMIVVLISALYPTRVAAKAANPSAEESFVIPEPDTEDCDRLSIPHSPFRAVTLVVWVRTCIRILKPTKMLPSAVSPAMKSPTNSRRFYSSRCKNLVSAI